MSTNRYTLDYRTLLNEHGTEVGTVNTCPIYACDCDEKEILKYAYMKVDYQPRWCGRKIFGIKQAFIYYKDIVFHDLSEANYDQYKDRIKGRYPSHICWALNHDVDSNVESDDDEYYDVGPCIVNGKRNKKRNESAARVNTNGIDLL